VVLKDERSVDACNVAVWIDVCVLEARQVVDDGCVELKDERCIDAVHAAVAVDIAVDRRASHNPSASRSQTDGEGKNDPRR
jgi:hypothetical protein